VNDLGRDALLCGETLGRNGGSEAAQVLRSVQANKELPRIIAAVA
jgi:hypothetical protein